MKSFKRLSFLLASAAVLVFSSCDPKSGEENQDKLTLKPSTETIKADGKEVVTFAVMLGNEDVTSKASIDNVTDKSAIVALTDNTFKSSVAGQYKFRATYNGLTSEEVAINVSSVTLTVDKNTILNNGEIATFTVMFDGADVTAESNITNITSKEAEWATGVNTFETTSAPGVYEFKAKYKGQFTNIIQITVAKAPISELRLAASKGRIKPDGTEFTTFTVFYQGNDVTATAKVKNLATDAYVENNTFSYTGSEKKINFVAEYNGMTSPVLSIGFGDFYKNVYIVKVTGTWCAYCAILAEAFNNALEIYPDRVAIVAAHFNDPLQISAFASFTTYYDITYGGQPNAPVTFFDGNSNVTECRLVGATSSTKVLELIKGAQRKGAGAGIAAVSKIDGNTLTIDVNVTADATKEYYIGAMLCEDAITGYPQTSDPDNLGPAYKHNHTLRAMGGNAPVGESVGTINENAQATKTFTFDLSKYKKENCNVVCTVSYKDGDSYVTANAITCPAGDWVDYRFEK